MLSHAHGGARGLSATPSPRRLPRRASRSAAGNRLDAPAEISDPQTQVRERLYQSPGGTRPSQALSRSAPGAGAPAGSRPEGRTAPISLASQERSVAASSSPPDGTDGRHRGHRDGSSRGIGGIFLEGKGNCVLWSLVSAAASLPRPSRALGAPLPLADACAGTPAVSVRSPCCGTRLCLPGERSQARFPSSLLPRFTGPVAACRIPSFVQQCGTSLELVGRREATGTGVNAQESAGLLVGLLGSWGCPLCGGVV